MNKLIILFLVVLIFVIYNSKKETYVCSKLEYKDRLDKNIDTYIKHIKLSNTNNVALEKLINHKKCCDNKKNRITQCKTILPLVIDIHIMTNFSFDLGGKKIENDIKSHEIRNTLLPYLNEIWRHACIKWELRNIYVENIDDNLVKDYPKDFYRNQKHKALIYMLKHLDMSLLENRIMLRNELFKMSNISNLNKNKFNIYIFPYLGKNITGLTFNLDHYGVMSLVGLWNNYYQKNNIKNDEKLTDTKCNGLSLFKMTKFQLAYLISKQLGYSLGLKESDNPVNIMSKNIIDLSTYIFKKQCGYAKNPNPYLSTHITSQIPKNMESKCTPMITSKLKHDLILKQMQHQDSSNNKITLFSYKQKHIIIKNILNGEKKLVSTNKDIIDYPLSAECKTVLAECNLFDRKKINNINEKNKCVHTVFKIINGKPLEELNIEEETYGDSDLFKQDYNPDKCIFPILSDVGKFICKIPKNILETSKICKKEEPKSYMDKIDFSHY